MKPYYQDKGIIYHGDCREILPQLDKGSAIVTDPPYELGFMGKSWDSKGVSFQTETWEIIRKSCLSGAMLLSFGGTRTFHRIAVAIEDAGWEIRDTLMWVYGSGFPKSLDIGKAVDKIQGNEREYLRTEKTQPKFKYSGSGKLQEKWIDKNTKDITKGSTIWEGYGTALKPAYEPIILAMNPLDGTFADNALKHGVAGLNIDECRIGVEERYNAFAGNKDTGFTSADSRTDAGKGLYAGKKEGGTVVQGRFPANFIHDGSQMVMELFPNSKSSPFKSATTKGHHSIHGTGEFDYTGGGYVDKGSAARFFYCAKASKAERDRGCDDLPLGKPQRWNKAGKWTNDTTPARNNHPTVKPLALMEYLVKLVKMPEYNLIIDPFMGSGTTLLACIKLGIPCIGIDNDEKSCEIAAKRCCQEVMELNA